MLTLHTLYVTFNKLLGIIPNEGNGLIFVIVNFTGNPYLCMEGLCGTNKSDINLTNKGDRIQIWTMVVGIFNVIGLSHFCCLWWWF